MRPLEDYMRLLKVLFASAILSGSLLTLATAKPEYAKKEGKSCTYCHVTMGKPDLNDTGKCYKENNHSLEKCKPPAKS
jgi:hypothetical protein